MLVGALGTLGALLNVIWLHMGRLCWFFPLKLVERIGTHAGTHLISQFFPLKLMRPKNGTHWNALERTEERTPNVAPVLVLPIQNRRGVGAHTGLNYNIIN